VKTALSPGAFGLDAEGFQFSLANQFPPVVPTQERSDWAWISGRPATPVALQIMAKRIALGKGRTTFYKGN
jgi:hypothetical protein